ncbi:hypothetical protein [Allokutzneria albata]|uniref:Uncharacterized protein n=1 Tax=Allokutzneria albata TaxID=211114 RepID=A0A1G9RD40_ALLAB|nr:hypothetical protein [Allokutzneria albata]SDM21229.1 hypothetical protein SAMN04489726_0389 [Allokutzneria albata]
MPQHATAVSIDYFLQVERAVLDHSILVERLDLGADHRADAVRMDLAGSSVAACWTPSEGWSVAVRSVFDVDAAPTGHQYLSPSPEQNTPSPTVVAKFIADNYRAHPLGR